MTYATVNSNLYLISLDQKLKGFRDFIGVWLYKSEAVIFLVDPGPKYSIRQLLDILKEINVKRIDYILLTHIHIDHAGGAGALLKNYPKAKVICHSKAIDHMISPGKLWKGSLKVLGNIAQSYGEIIPIAASAIEYSDRIGTQTGDIKVFETPGHAIHHLCFQFRNYLFAGEVAGFTYCLKNGIYTRPSTPPRFKLKTSLSSIDRIKPFDASMICYGHYGFRTDVEKALIEAQNQLLLWVSTVKEQLEIGEERLQDRIMEMLKKKDPAFAKIKNLPKDIRQREIYFVGNSLKGMIEYLKAYPNDPFCG